jgi:thioesterase domain-containing protein
VSTLFHSATVEHLSEVARASGSVKWSSLVPLKTLNLLSSEDKGMIQTNLFCIHPGGGQVLCYGQLAQYLSPNQTVYGLQAQGIEGTQEPLTSVAEMAELYLKSIRKAQKTGPYLLAGWSFGGLVALEVAQQLILAGEQVENLFLLDPPANAWSTEPLSISRAEMLVELLTDKVQLDVDELEGLSDQQQMQHIVSKGKAVNVFPNSFDVRQAEQILDVILANDAASHTYRPQAYTGNTTLIRPQQELLKDADKSAGWSDLVQGQLSIESISGSHLTMLDEPHVKQLAKILNKSTDNSERGEQ